MTRSGHTVSRFRGRAVPLKFGVVLKKGNTYNGESSLRDGGHCSPELWFGRVTDSQTL